LPQPYRLLSSSLPPQFLNFSEKRRGGALEDYIPIHNWFDESKQIIADFRHRILRVARIPPGAT
jgi:hypothetical protein